MKLAIAVALLALTGCAATGDFIEDHPRTSTFIAAGLMASVALSMDRRGHGPIQRDVATPSVNCDGGSCK